MSHSDGLPPDAAIGRVALRVADLDRQVDFYERVVGLAAIERSDGGATLGVDGTELLRLEERPDLEPSGRDETGLFHTAFLFPDRAALGDALDRVEERWQLTGASDHLVSEALYLDDTEGNGVELYRDRPREEWTIHDDGRIDIDTLGLDLQPIRDAAAGEDGAPSETTVGHVHLEVSDVDAGRQFYVDELGMGLKQTYGPNAIFVAAGDYHHHVGANTWNGRTEPGEGLGLDWFEVVVPDEEAMEAVRQRFEDGGRDCSDGERGFAVDDPDRIELRVRVEE
jgi:catechol 2,3-dioxygenase